MPLILGTNSIKDTGFNVANSLRFNDGSSDHLTKTPSSAGNRRTWTFSAWVKKCMPETGGNQRLIACGSGTGGLFTSIEYGSSDRIRILEGTEGGSSSVFVRGAGFNRDPSAWQHVVVKYDSTQGTAADRIEIYLNGVEVTYDSTTYPSSNKDSEFNNNVVHTIGATSVGSSVGSFFDGYMAEVVLIDGQALSPTSFGEFDSDSPTIWKPIDVSGLTFGTNGFYLDFEDSSALGNDAAGSNNFTVNNLAATDQSLDTCTNNFATLNPLFTPNVTPTYSEGNLQSVSTNSGYDGGYSSIGVSSGRWYAEVKFSATSDSGYVTSYVSFCDNPAEANRNNHDRGAYQIVYRSQGQVNPYGTGDVSSGFDSFAVGDILGLYMDLDNSEMYFAKNGVLQNSGTGITINALNTGFGFFSCGDSTNAAGMTHQWNFGSPSFSISSGNTDANGYGNFEYDPSSGTFDGASKNFYALNTKNLAEFG